MTFSRSQDISIFSRATAGGRLNTGIGMTRVFITNVRFVRSFWNRAGEIIPIHMASTTICTVSLCGVVNCFAAMQYRSPTAPRHSKKASPILFVGRGAQDVGHLFLLSGFDERTSIYSNLSRPHQAAGGGPGRAWTLEGLFLVS